MAQQIIEGTFARKLGWGTANATPLTVGFWSRCSSPLTFSYYIRNVIGTDAAYLKEITVAGNTWTWNSFTVPANANGTWNSNTSTCFHTGLSLACGTDYANSTLETWLTEANTFGSTTQDNFSALGAGNTFNTTGWIAIPGEHTISEEDAHKFLLPYDYELQRCQRYYEITRHFWNGVSAGALHNYSSSVGFAAAKRTLPSFSFGSQTNSARFPSASSAATGDILGASAVYVAASSGGNEAWGANVISNARMS